jgi:hypothetical protein
MENTQTAMVECSKERFTWAKSESLNAIGKYYGRISVQKSVLYVVCLGAHASKNVQILVRIF